jgi:hypothetical protein
MTENDDRSPFERLLFEDAPPPPPHLTALGQRFVDAARPKFRNFRVDLEAIEIVASKAGRAGEISADDGAQLFLDRGDSLSLPLVRRYVEACETELVARWLMTLGSFHFTGWATPRNLAALDGMVAAGEPALAVSVVRKHLEKTQRRARDLWRAVARKIPVNLPPDRLARYQEGLAKLRWELPGEIEAARIEIAELEAYVRDHGSPEDNRALDTMLADLDKARSRFT